MPRERPILFSGPMVRELLAGRKTQTRRPVKWEPLSPGLNLGFTGLEVGHTSGERPWVLYSAGAGGLWEERTKPLRCPYGSPGDRLWVRETWFEEFDPVTCKPYDPPRACYAAMHEGEVRKMDGDGGTVFRKDGWAASPWRPGIHMPRWASRLLLEVEAVRVERLDAITEDDARAEGMEFLLEGTRDATPRDTFLRRWDGMYAGGDFARARNPWVWVVTFRRLEAARSAA